MPALSRHPVGVEVDIYNKLLPDTNYKVYAGIDIGSTSTKCILIDEGKKPVAGFYTYTAGKPVSAAKALLEAIENVFRQKK
jgi:activator of 2-hydroxyglutaryl-CoA dehydratase